MINNLTGSQIKTGSFTVSGGAIYGTFSGSIIPSSIIPFASPASYVIFSGSITGVSGSFFAISGSNNQLAFNSSDFSILLASTWNSLSNGGKIFIRAGTYSIVNTPSLSPTSNITLEGEGAATIIQLANGASRPIINISGSFSNFILANITIDGNGSNQTNVNNISLISFPSTSTSAIRILNCVFQNSRNSCIATAASDTLIVSSRFSNNVLGLGFGTGFQTGGNFFISPILITGNASQSNVRIIGNAFENNFGCISDVDLSSTNVIITNNVFKNNYTYVNVSVNAFAGVIINDNVFSFAAGGNTLTNFIALGSTDTLVQNNYFFGNLTQAHIYAPLGLFNIITDNEFNGSVGPNNAFILTQSTGNNSFLTISNNLFKISDSNEKGMSIQNVNNFTIQGNQFYLPFGGIPISFDIAVSSNGIISNNIFNGGSLKFNITPTNVIISGNLP